MNDIFCKQIINFDYNIPLLNKAIDSQPKNSNI